jgi:hypothetical protein
VVIDDFHVVGITLDPSEADAPLIVDPNAVLTLAATLEGAIRLAGGMRRSSSTKALPSMRSLRRTTDWISAGSRREVVPPQIFSASLSAKFLIMGKP